jgi:hypothetical protein
LIDLNQQHRGDSDPKTLNALGELGYLKCLAGSVSEGRDLIRVALIGLVEENKMSPTHNWVCKIYPPSYSPPPFLHAPLSSIFGFCVCIIVLLLLLQKIIIFFEEILWLFVMVNLCIKLYAGHQVAGAIAGDRGRCSVVRGSFRTCTSRNCI